MDYSKRIDLINAYKALETLELKLKVNDDVKKIVQTEFNQWVLSRISDLLGDGKAKTSDLPFTPEQLEALSEVANQVLSRKGQTQVNKLNPSQRDVRTKPSPAQVPVDKNQTQDFNNAVLKQLAELRKMEEGGPEY